MKQGIKWARNNDFAGLMLETQEVNVSACSISYGCHFDSQLSIDEVHGQFGEIQYGRFTKVINECLPYDFENKGLIQVLVDDWEKEIWWGKIENFL